MQNLEIQKFDKSFDAAVISQPECGEFSDHAACAAIPFEALEIDWEPPSAKEWYETAQADGITFRLVHSLLQKTKDELLEGVEAEPEAFMELVECIGSYKSRNETTQEMLSAANV